jgi:hypothetical protein
MSLALDIQGACAVFLYVACLAVQHFPHILIKGTIFEKQNFIDLKMFVLILSKNFN